MDFFRLPDLLNTQLPEDLDSQGSRTVLGHRHIGRQDSNLPRMMDFPACVSLDTDNLLSERKGIIVQDRLRQLRSRGGTKTVVIKDETLSLVQDYDKIVTSTFVPRNSPRLAASSLTSCFWTELRWLNGWTFSSVCLPFPRCSHIPPANPSMSRTGLFP